MNYFQAGYFLIFARPYALPGEVPLFLPTVSGCINTLLPDIWALSWSGKSQDELAMLERDFGIDEQKLARIQVWGDQALNQQNGTMGALGWPNVLTGVEVARAFYRDFLTGLPLRLIGIALPEDQLELALASLAPTHQREGECGLYLMLRRHLPENSSGKLLGYEIMGAEIGGSLHSFYCNHLHKDYRTLGCRINAEGLLGDAADARRALEFTLDENTRAEPVPWFSFRLREFAL